jgi:hypothetical protein
MKLTGLLLVAVDFYLRPAGTPRIIGHFAPA